MIFSILAISSSSCAATELNGTPLKSHQYNAFEFIDHAGRKIPELSNNGTGAVVSFLFTHCTDVCPITVHKIKKALHESDHPEIPVIIFSVDPERDDQTAIQKFIEKWDLSENWFFVGGKPEKLEGVWKEFYVSPIKSQTSSTKDTLADKFAEKYNITHTAPVFVLDQKGIARVVHSRIQKPEDLAQDINTILKQYK